MNEDHSMPDWHWKLSCDTEFININMNTLWSHLGSQYLHLPVYLGGLTLAWESNWMSHLFTFSNLLFEAKALPVQLLSASTALAVSMQTAVTELRWYPAPSCNSTWRKSRPEICETSILLSDWRHALYNICLLFNSASSSFLTNKTWRGCAYLVAALSVPSLWTVNNTQQIK